MSRLVLIVSALLFLPVMAPAQNVNLAGWTRDDDASQRFGVTVLVSANSSIATTPAVMYRKQIDKQRLLDGLSLAQLIADDRSEFEINAPDIVVEEVAPLRDSKGSRVTCIAYSPADAGNWERVAYVEDGDFYLVFTVSASSEASLKNALPAFGKLVGSYGKLAVGGSDETIGGRNMARELVDIAGGLTQK